MTRGATRLVRGAAAATATVVFVVGVPVALATAVGWPLPRTTPALADISATLDGSIPLDPRLLWRVLAVGVWVAWAQLVAALVLEVRSVLRGGLARPVTGLGRCSSSPPAWSGR